LLNGITAAVHIRTCADDRLESYCGRIGFDDSVVTMTNTSTATMIIGGGGGKPGGGGGKPGGGGGR
jgi:hypothetical protein